MERVCARKARRCKLEMELSFRSILLFSIDWFQTRVVACACACACASSLVRMRERNAAWGNFESLSESDREKPAFCG
jgi:hypothetical protein